MRWRYSLDSLRKLIRNPSLLPKAWRLFRDDLSNVPLNIDRRWYQWRYGGSGAEFIDAPWDNLIIVDAARPELLRPYVTWNGEFTTRTSPASFSREFIEKQFNGRQLHDTVYITANPHVHDVEDGVFHAIVNLLETDWDPDLKTVHPADVVTATLEAAAEYPTKRLIVHFMQPHFPFLGPAGKDIPSGIAKRIGEGDDPHPWYEQMGGQGTAHETLIRAYRENHKIVCEHVETLLSKLDGQSVIAADHANLIGERGFPIPIRLYGHPMYFPHPNLLKVPWITVDGERRTVTADAPVERTRMDDDTIENRLAALGYAD